jgi:integrase
MPKLTKRYVEAARPQAGPDAGDFFLWDEEVRGFGLRVWPSGRKSFVFKYQLGGRDGRTQRVTIGDYGPLTVELARKQAAQLRADVFAGRSPAADRAARRRAAAAAHHAPTVVEIADAFLVECAAKLKPSTVAEYRRLLGVSAVRRGPSKGSERAGELRAALGRFKVADVTRAQVAKLHLGMAGRPYMANRALAMLSALFTYAERHGHRPDGTNPCRGIAEYRETKRERYLSETEYAALGDALLRAQVKGLPVPPSRQRRRATPATVKHRPKDTAPDGVRPPAPFNPVGVGVLRFLLLSGWRQREALTLRWSQVDFARGVATLPDTKTGRSVRELGTPALAVLDEMRRFQRAENPYVFPGLRPGACYTDTARVWDAVRNAARLPDVRLHDLRHAFASVAASGGLTLPVIGALLGHTDSATTARYAHLVESSRKRAAEQTSAAIATALVGRAVREQEAQTPPLAPLTLAVSGAGSRP